MPCGLHRSFGSRSQGSSCLLPRNLLCTRGGTPVGGDRSMMISTRYSRRPYNFLLASAVCSLGECAARSNRASAKRRATLTPSTSKHNIYLWMKTTAVSRRLLFLSALSLKTRHNNSLSVAAAACSINSSTTIVDRFDRSR